MSAAAETGAVKEGSVSQLTVEKLVGIPSEQWEERPPYQEIADINRYRVEGFQTTLDLSGHAFSVVLELRSRLLSPDLEAQYGSRYRIRVDRTEEDGTVSTELWRLRNTPQEGIAAHLLYERLHNDIAEPRMIKKADAGIRLRDDFEAAIRSSKS